MTPRPPLNEWLSLFRAVIAREGVTTGAGAATGDSIVDAALIGVGDNSFFTMLMVVYPGDFNLVDSMDITGFDNGTGEVTLSSAYKGVAAAIPAGVPYEIVTFKFVPAEVAAIAALVDARVMGRVQIAHTTIDLNQVAGTYDLFTATTQDVEIEGLVIRMPAIVAGGALTSISIQTDDVTPQIFITAAEGAVANLTSEAQLSWAPASGITLLDAGTGAKIQLTIAGGAHGVAYVCDVVAVYRAVASGGYLA